MIGGGSYERGRSPMKKLEGLLWNSINDVISKVVRMRKDLEEINIQHEATIFR